MLRMPDNYFKKLELQQPIKLRETQVQPEEPETPKIEAPEAEKITASAEEIISDGMRSNIICTSTQNIQPGVYILPEGRVTVHTDSDDKTGVQFVGEKVIDFDRLLRRIKNITPTETLTNNPSGVNGEIDEPVSQGGTGDCWLITAILALTSSEEGRKLIKDSIEIKENGDVVIHFKGVGKSITVTAAEIAKHDTDNIKNDPFSNGDNDMLAFELATEKLFEQYPELLKHFNLNDKLLNDADGFIDQGGMANDLFLLLTDEKNIVGSNFALDDLDSTIANQNDVTMVPVPGTIGGYAGKSMPCPKTMTEDKMFNEDKSYFSEEYVQWYNEWYGKLCQETLVRGMSKEDTLNLLKQLYDVQPCAVTFGLYLYAGETEKSARCTDGSTFTFNYTGAKKGQYCGHSFSIVDMTKDTVTFVNPWDSSEK